MSKFKYPVCIQVNQEQYERLTKELDKLGYEHYNYDGSNGVRSTHTWLLTEFGGKEGTYDINQRESGHICTSEEEFLALAAMREGDEPHVGEWFKVLRYANCYYVSYEKGEIFRITSIGEVANKDRRSIGTRYNRDVFQKANKEDLILHFKNKQEMNGGMHSDQKGKLIGYKLIKPEYREVALKISQTVGNWENSLMPYDISITQKGYIKRLTEAGVLDLWFEPCYKQEERFLTVNCDQGQFVVKVIPQGFEYEGKVVPLAYIKGLVNQMTSQASVGGWKVLLNTVNIGCKTNITLDSLHDLIEQYERK